jgi:hypothetical protein
MRAHDVAVLVGIRRAAIFRLDARPAGPTANVLDDIWIHTFCKRLTDGQTKPIASGQSKILYTQR